MCSEVVTILDNLDTHADRVPEKDAFTFQTNVSGRVTRLTFESLRHAVSHIGGALSETFPAGARIGLVYAASIEFIVAFLGCIQAGLVPVPVGNIKGKRSVSPSIDRVRAVLRAARPVAVLCLDERDMELLGEHSGLAAQLISHTKFASAASAACIVRRRYTDLAFIQFTSGSTSEPKGVLVTHGNLLENEEAILQAFGHDETSVVVGWLPMHHDMGLVGNVLQSVYAGLSCHLMSPEDFVQRPTKWLELISEVRGTTSGGPSFAYEHCVARADGVPRSLDLATWRVAFNGAEPINPTVIERFSKRFSRLGFRRESVFPCYGLAEATLFVTGSHIIDVDVPRFSRKTSSSAFAADIDGKVITSCGPLAGRNQVTILSIDGSGRSLQDGEVGEIVVTGLSVSPGYLHENYNARKEEVVKPLRTGDLGFAFDGQLYVVGRMKDVIIIRGENHYPSDIEFEIMRSFGEHGVHAVCVFGVNPLDSPTGAEEMVVSIEAASSVNKEDAAVHIRRLVLGRFGIRVLEVTFHRRFELNRTTSGKIQRQLVRDSHLAKLQIAAGDVSGRGEGTSAR